MAMLRVSAEGFQKTPKIDELGSKALYKRVEIDELGSKALYKRVGLFEPAYQLIVQLIRRSDLDLVVIAIL